LAPLLRQVKRLAAYEGGLALIWLALTALAMIPLWSARILPMLESPTDLAIGRIWHSLQDPVYHLSEFYALRFRALPGQLFPLLIHLLLYVSPIQVANKLVLSIYVIAFPLSVGFLARALGRSPWLALGAFPLLFSRNWMFGYGGFLLGSAALFFGWALVLRILRTGSRRDLSWLLLATGVAYFAHVVPWLLLIVGGLALILNQLRGPRHWVGALLGLLPSMILAGLMLMDELGEQVFFKSDEWHAVYRDFPALVIDFPKRAIDVMQGSFDYVIGGVMLAALVALLALQRPESEDAAERRKLPLLLITLTCGYMLLPWEVKKPFVVLNCAARVAPLLATLFLLLPKGAIHGRMRLLFTPILIAGVAMPLRLSRLYRDFGRRNLGFARLLHEVPHGASTMVFMRWGRYASDSIDAHTDAATTGAVYWHWTEWPLVFSGGHTPSLDLTATSVERLFEVKVQQGQAMESFDIHALPDYEFYLVRSAPDSMSRQPALKIVDQLGDWTLYHRVFGVSDEP
jgi:hypothetical protein